MLSAGNRATSIGSSDIAPILGISPFGGPWEVFAQKRGLITFEETDRMRWGKRLQRPVAEGWAEDNGVKIEWLDRPFISAQREWQTASPDAIQITPRKIVEIKMVALDQWRDWHRPDDGIEDADCIPEYYFVQAQWQMSTLLLSECTVVAMLGGNQVYSYNLNFDDELEELLLDEGERFYRDHLLPGIPPPPGGSEVARKYLKAKYPRETLPIRCATDQEVQWLRRYGQVKREIEPLEAEHDALEASLKQSVGDNAGIFWGTGRRVSGKFTWKKCKDRQEVNWEALAENQLEGYSTEEKKNFYQQFTETIHGSRRVYFREDED